MSVCVGLWTRVLNMCFRTHTFQSAQGDLHSHRRISAMAETKPTQTNKLQLRGQFQNTAHYFCFKSWNAAISGGGGDAWASGILSLNNFQIASNSPRLQLIGLEEN